MKRVVITGVGIVSCLGTDPETIAGKLQRGESAVRVDPERLAIGFQSPLTTQIDGFNERQHLNRKARKTMTEFSVQAYAASVDAVAQAGLAPEDLQNDRTGLIFGCDSSALAAIEQVDLIREHRSTGVIGSGHIFRSMTSNITMNLNTLFKTRGACWTLSAACSSGGHALGQAADLIRLGRQDRVLCGGAQEINWESVCSFDALDAFSSRVEAPARACRPFDAGRDGLVPSGGAAAVLLEDYELARSRNATILGEVLGYGFSSDGENISVPSDKGLFRAMRGALADAHVQPQDVDYICAHATGTPAGDGQESLCIHSLYPDMAGPAVASLKGLVGHELWMAGAAQVVYCTLMAKYGFTAASANFNTPDEDSAKINILTETRRTPPRTVLCNAAGFGGTNSCLVISYPT